MTIRYNAEGVARVIAGQLKRCDRVVTVGYEQLIAVL
jgi:hypothetical protein